VHDNYKFHKTTQVRGAKQLFLKFDDRCSSQYDYDKLIVYAGPNSQSPKVGEYGGNTAGFGNSASPQCVWPKHPVRVPGDTVTLYFEVKSGRENGTPDHAMWGFAVTIGSSDEAEPASELAPPFLIDLELSVCCWECELLEVFYRGPSATATELA